LNRGIFKKSISWERFLLLAFFLWAGSKFSEAPRFIGAIDFFSFNKIGCSKIGLQDMFGEIGMIVRVILDSS